MVIHRRSEWTFSSIYGSGLCGCIQWVPSRQKSQKCYNSNFYLSTTPFLLSKLLFKSPNGVVLFFLVSHLRFHTIPVYFVHSYKRESKICRICKILVFVMHPKLQIHYNLWRYFFSCLKSRQKTIFTRLKNKMKHNWQMYENIFAH